MTAEPLTVLVVDDDPAQRHLLAGCVASLGYRPAEAASAEEALADLERGRPALMLLDVRLPGLSGLDALAPVRRIAPSLPVILVTAYADLRQAVAAVRDGADDYLAKPIDLDELAAAVADALGRRDVGRRPVTLPDLPADLVCVSPAFRRVLETAAVVAPADAPVLILGESGAGKEVVARLVHRWGPRAAGPLVVANCAGLPPTLVESELFGHARGAFTGADRDRPGLFRAADRGTLFLDEIGELPLALQPKLLRAVETGEVTPVGQDVTVRVDVRLVAATHRDLAAAVRDGGFREDLYYRLNVVELAVPPLRERPEDVLPLARAFAAGFTRLAVRFSPQATQALLAHPWPGNVRELRNAVQRACLLCRGDVVLPSHLPPAVAAHADAAPPAPTDAGRLCAVERAAIRAALDECGGNRTQAARKLGLSRRGLLYKLRAMEKGRPGTDG